MAAIALQTEAGSIKAITVVEPPLNAQKLPEVAGGAITAGQPVRYDANGNVIPSKADTGTNAKVLGIAWKDTASGNAVTVFKAGVFDGFDLSALAYGDPVYLQDAGGLGTTAGTTSVKIGEVVAGHAQNLGTAPDKLLRLTL